MGGWQKSHCVCVYRVRGSCWKLISSQSVIGLWFGHMCVTENMHMDLEDDGGVW